MERFLKEAKETLEEAKVLLKKGQDFEGLLLIDKAGKLLARAAIYGDSKVIKLSLDKDFFDVERMLAFSKNAPIPILLEKLDSFLSKIDELEKLCKA